MFSLTITFVATALCFALFVISDTVLHANKKEDNDDDKP